MIWAMRPFRCNRAAFAKWNPQILSVFQLFKQNIQFFGTTYLHAYDKTLIRSTNWEVNPWKLCCSIYTYGVKKTLTPEPDRLNIWHFSLKLPPNIKILDFLAQSNWIQQIIHSTKSILWKCAFIFSNIHIFKAITRVLVPKTAIFLLKLAEISKNVDFLAKYGEKTNFKRNWIFHVQATNA